MDTVSSLARPNRLRDLRLRSRLTQEEVAKLLDISHSTVAKHEAGTRNIDGETLRKYARVFKVDTVEIYLSPEQLGRSDVWTDESALQTVDL